jgi:putative PIN family toxin of toxin-antitoxin system
MASPLGASGAIIRAALAGLVELIISSEILSEFADASSDPDVLRLFNRRGVAPQEYDRLVERIAAVALVVDPQGEAPPCRDEEDRMFLHSALAGDADYLVTYDDDLLVLGSIGRAAIMKPGNALARLKAGGVAI